MASLRTEDANGKNMHYMSITSDNEIHDDLDISSKKRDMNNGPSSWIGSFCGNRIDYNMNPTVFIISTIIIWSFVIWCLLDSSSSFVIISDIQNHLVKYFSWLYVGSVVIFMLFMVFLLFHPRYSKIKLGKENETPKYNLVTWFSMLFSAGFGSGMYFYGVAEPVLHFRDAVEGYNRYSDLPRQQQAVSSLNLSWFHGSFACLSIYCTVGVLIGFLSHKYDFPMTMRTCFYPLIGNKIYGVIGDAIDITAVVATMFGLTTSLGMGVMQINSGLTRLFGGIIPNNSNTKIIILWIITIAATISVVTGIDKGIKRLSQLNFGFGCILLLYLFFVGDTFFLLNLFIETLGYHLNSFFVTISDTDAFEQSGFDQHSNPKAWMAWWTVFYWGWWIAWAPFVGTFIAQISRGRTIRQFILYNTLIPAFAVYCWCTIMGGLGIQLEWHALDNNIGNDCYYNSAYNGTISDGHFTRLSCADISDQLFILIEYYPLADFMSLITIIAIIGYFVTSSDSASYVIDLITSNGTQHTPKCQRVFWALTEGAVASALLFGGGDTVLEALQTVSIASALPFTIVLILIVYATLKAFNMKESELKQNMYSKHSKHSKQILYSESIDRNHNDKEIKIWKVEFFDGLFNDFYICIMAIIMPCIIQFRNGKTIGMYGNGKCWNDIIWEIFVFVPPILFVLLHLLQLYGDGFASLAWVVYIGFVSVGAYHRIKIREYYHLKGNALVDITSHCCCCCFAVAQESLQCQSVSTVVL